MNGAKDHDIVFDRELLQECLVQDAGYVSSAHRTAST